MSIFSIRSKTGDDWETPKELYEALNKEFNFNDDPCPLYGKERGENGLKREWGERTFINPPYSNVLPWVKKAYEESNKGKLVVALLRADTSTKWFHEWVLGKAKIRFIRGRLKFGKSKKPAPFANLIAIWDGRKK